MQNTLLDPVGLQCKLLVTVCQHLPPSFFVPRWCKWQHHVRCQQQPSLIDPKHLPI